MTVTTVTVTIVTVTTVTVITVTMALAVEESVTYPDLAAWNLKMAEAEKKSTNKNV